jgi:hypothetical protein
VDKERKSKMLKLSEKLKSLARGTALAGVLGLSGVALATLPANAQHGRASAGFHGGGFHGGAFHGGGFHVGGFRGGFHGPVAGWHGGRGGYWHGRWFGAGWGGWRGGWWRGRWYGPGWGGWWGIGLYGYPYWGTPYPYCSDYDYYYGYCSY